MNAFLIFLGTLAMLVASAVGGMVRDEIRTRLTRIPYGVLRLAALLVPADQRDDLRAEWRAEVTAIFEKTKDVPFTGLVRAAWYVLGLLASGRAVARELDGTAGERRRQLLDLLTRIKRGARVLTGWLGGSGPRRQVMTASTPAGTMTVTGRAALAASAAFTAAAVATVAFSPVTVMSTALVVLPQAGQNAAAAASGQPGPFTATQEVIAGSDQVLSGALPDVRPAMPLTELRHDIQIGGLTPYVLSVSATGKTARDAEATANAVARSYIQSTGSSSSPAGRVPAELLEPATSATGTAPLMRLLVGAMLGMVSGMLTGVIVAAVSRRLTP